VEARIIGLQGSGKSTLLEALAEGHSGSGMASVKVADTRLRNLAGIFTPRKTTFAEFHVRDVDWPRREGRRSEMDRFFASLQGTHVFLHVLRAFDNPALGTPPDPGRDLAELDGAFALGDLVIADTALERARKQPMDEITKRALTHCREALDHETPVRLLTLDDAERRALRTYGLRTMVPQVILVNLPAGSVEQARSSLGESAHGRDVVALPFLDAREVAELSHEEQAEFAQALGLPGPAGEVVTRTVIHQMGLITFFTVGPVEVRAWEITRGSTAREAAGSIHSDMERGFIRAEVVAYHDFMAHGSMKACRDAGVLRLEGRDYIVADGDIMTVRFSV
jgi:ribosome-binding ATPase YchF (GTP1/OBG family)